MLQQTTQFAVDPVGPLKIRVYFQVDIIAELEGKLKLLLMIFFLKGRLFP
jgi:hypothetical protein